MLRPQQLGLATIGGLLSALATAPTVNAEPGTVPPGHGADAHPVTAEPQPIDEPPVPLPPGPERDRWLDGVRERTEKAVWDRRSMSAEAHFGVGTPVGYLGLAGELGNRYLAFGFGVGNGSGGEQVSAHARLRYPVGYVAVGVGAGLSRGDYVRFSLDSNDAEDDEHQDVLWQNLDLFYEVRHASGATLRAYGGVARSRDVDDELGYVGVAVGFAWDPHARPTPDGLLEHQPVDVEAGATVVSLPFVSSLPSAGYRFASGARVGDASVNMSVLGSAGSDVSFLSAGVGARFGRTPFVGGGLAWSALTGDGDAPSGEQLDGSGPGTFAEVGTDLAETDDISLRVIARADVALYSVERRRPGGGEPDTIVGATATSLTLGAVF